VLIEPRYRDPWGQERVVPEDTLRRLREILGNPVAVEAPRIEAPPSAFLPRALEEGGRDWGIAVQLYGLRSRRNWGMGDFGDLARLIECASDAGVGAIGLNPLHALFPGDPGRYSPYAPSSRLLLNVLYIDIEAVPEFVDCTEARARVASAEFQEALEELRAAPLVEYAGVAARKFEILELLYAHFRVHVMAAGGARAAAFRRFQEDRGAPLRALAVFETLSERHGPSWRDWPEELRHPSVDDIARIAPPLIERVEYYEYLQFLADEQLAHASTLCRARGMAVGLYIDLAVGVDINGAEAWSNQHVLALGASVGAPPDAMNLKGQDWGFPPYHPVRLRAAGYEPFVSVLRSNMRRTGALRIDHILGLVRLYWVPWGVPPTDGGYVRYNFDELSAVIARESHAYRCMVIGEDLGTVPDGLREHMRERNLLSYRLLYFERGDGGRFKSPAEYPELALAAVSTHDLATLRGWWSGHDLAVRGELGLFPSAEIERREHEERDRDRHLLLDALRHEGLFAGSVDAHWHDFAAAVHRYVARTPSKLLMVQLEDALGLEDQVNLPGTVSEHPNWRRKLPFEIETLFDNPDLRAVLAAVAAERAR
jgi:(1->4)-alpha-D-glucan 1-alpha-D-glucosylmutase